MRSKMREILVSAIGQIRPFIDRQEFLACIPLIISILASRLFSDSIPKSQLDHLMVLSSSILVMAVIEGSVRPDYGASLRKLIGSAKFKAFLIASGSIIINDWALKPWNIYLPPNLIENIVNLLIVSVILKGGSDAARSVLSSYERRGN